MRWTRTAAMLLLVACGGGESPSGPGGVASVRMIAGAITLYPGQTELLSAAALDAAGAVVGSAGPPVWQSANASVVSVTPTGTVTALATGTADVTASFGSLTGTTRVSVIQAPLSATVSMPGLSFAPFKVFLRQGGTIAFEFPQTPHNVIFQQKAGVPSDIQTTSNVRLHRTFSTLGVFPYDCTLHPGMSGEVEVVP
jgi:plastocyanin